MDGVVITFALFVAALLVVVYIRYRLCHMPDGGDLEASIDAEVNQFIKKGHSYGVVVDYKGGNLFI